MLRVSITGQITIDDAAAEVLEHICAYKFADEFYERCSHKFKPEVIRNAIGKLRSESDKIIAARQVAIDAINGKARLPE